MKEEALLMLFNKEYIEHLLSSKIDTTDERSLCNLFKMFAWGYRLAEKHSNSSISDIEYCLTEYAEELEGFSLLMLDVLDWDISGKCSITSSQLRHFANSSDRLAKELFSYIEEEISPKKEPTPTTDQVQE